MAWRAWLPDRAPRPWQSILIGFGLAGAATAVRLVADGQLGRELPFVTYFPALIFSAALGGAVGGMRCLAEGPRATVAGGG